MKCKYNPIDSQIGKRINWDKVRVGQYFSNSLDPKAEYWLRSGVNEFISFYSNGGMGKPYKFKDDEMNGYMPYVIRKPS